MGGSSSGNGSGSAYDWFQSALDAWTGIQASKNAVAIQQIQSQQYNPANQSGQPAFGAGISNTTMIVIGVVAIGALFVLRRK